MTKYTNIHKLPRKVAKNIHILVLIIQFSSLSSLTGPPKITFPRLFSSITNFVTGCPGLNFAHLRYNFPNIHKVHKNTLGESDVDGLFWNIAKNNSWAFKVLQVPLAVHQCITNIYNNDSTFTSTYILMYLQWFC